MRTTVKLPIGTDNFEEIRQKEHYYVDKTGLIKELLGNGGKINLITRPRRFGKSLNMSMLKYFFEYGCDVSLFEGLAIVGERELCEKYMGKFPVVSVSLKDASGRKYEDARGMLCNIIGKEAMRFQFLKKSDRLSENEKIQYGQLIVLDTTGCHGFLMSQEILSDSLLTLCELLHKHYGRKVVLLIDEYDVPLDKAQHYGYYDEMTALVRNLYSRALKSNEHLEIAVLTGCLKIAKESIFTGLNNLRIFSIMEKRFDEYFGFLEVEVSRMLAYYGAGGQLAAVREWYDGYHFGDADVYCPWDVVNYCADLRDDPQASPRAYWVNTSGNDIVRSFMEAAGRGTRRELEALVNGGAISKKINQELTYRDLYATIDNLWSVLYMTGYLTKSREETGDDCPLVIPNKEIRGIFVEQFLEWFREDAQKDASRLDAFCEAFIKGDANAIETQFSAYLSKVISVRDTGARKGRKENFYHGILLGLLSHQEDWYIRSNVESGDGYSDILIEVDAEDVGIVIEVKYPESGDKAALEKGSREALAQIERLGYDRILLEDGMRTIRKYGIACNRKECSVAVG